jgi:hypothetical protein
VFIMVIIMTTIIIHSDHARLFANHNCWLQHVNFRSQESVSLQR